MILDKHQKQKTNLSFRNNTFSLNFFKIQIHSHFRLSIRVDYSTIQIHYYTGYFCTLSYYIVQYKR